MTIFNTAIAASSDDAREVGAGTTAIADTFLHTGVATGVLVGLRFTGVTIPQGATINSAILTLRSSASNDDPDLDIYGQAADNAATFTTSSYNISGRTRTTAKTNWTASNVGLAQLVDSPDFKSVVQEIVDRPGWSSGNALVVITISLSASTLAFRAWDQGSTPPEITIDYTPPAYTESLTFGRGMTAGATAQGAASAGLTVGRGMTAGLPGAAAVGPTLDELAYVLTVTSGSAAAAQTAVTLDVARSVGTTGGRLLAELLTLAAQRGVDVVAALDMAADVTLERAGDMAVGNAADLQAAMLLLSGRDVSADALAATLAGLHLERADMMTPSPLAALAEAMGLSVHRAMMWGIEANIIVTHRYVLVVDRENRLFVVQRENRAFIVNRGA